MENQTRKPDFLSHAPAVRSLLVAAAALLLSGCGPLISLGDDGPADDVFSLEYDGANVNTSDMATIIYVEEPLMSDGLGGVDVAVALENRRRTSLKGVRWSSNSTDLIRDYFIRAIGSMSGTRLLGQGAIDVRAGCRLGVKVWAFEFVPGNSAGDDRVDIEVEFILVRYSDNRLIGQPTLSASTQVGTANGENIVEAFHGGMTSISREAGKWLKPLANECALSAADK